MEIDIPRDREAKFEPIIIKKYERDISKLVDMIFALYSRGMLTRDVTILCLANIVLIILQR
ncbi:transposase, partial [Mycoplasmopsis fermentans]|uniref:transposase n=1 Tax=Mycoplasmopsis fermentans TaxID=2115 RepID=UPI00218088BF